MAEKQKAVQELKEPKYFKYATFLARNKWRVSAVACLIVAVLIVIGFVQHSKKKRDARALQARLAAATAADFEKVERQFPGTFHGSASLLEAGNLFFKEGKFAQARKLYLKFLETHRESALRSWAYNLVGTTFEAERKYDEAIQYYRRAEATPWAKLQAKLNIGRCYELKGDYDAARTYYRQLTEPAPTSPGSPPMLTAWQREAQARMNTLSDKERKARQIQSEKKVDKGNP